MNSNRYKLLIFDWDGTLIDSEVSIVSSMRMAVQDVGLDARPDDDIKHIIGLGLSEALETLFPGQSNRLYAKLVDRYRHHFFAHEPSQPFPQVKSALMQLDQAGYLLAVATGKGRRGLDLAMENTALGPLFAASRCADETLSKPHPLMLQEILTQLDMDSDQALMIGDTSYDIEMAHNAGMDSVAVCTGVHDRTHLLQSQPSVCLQSMPDLLAWLSD